MPLVTTTEMFKKAYEGGYAVGAFNVNNMEIVQGIVDAAKEEQSPLILQVSAGARKYAKHIYLVKLVEAALEDSNLPIALHLDHGDSFEICKDCVDGGFTSVMIDASHHDFDENVKITKQVVEYAHAHGVVVEAELGRLAGVEDDVNVSDADARFTDPEQAAEFVALTGVDSLAIAIGTSHGAYKFTRKPTGDILSIQRVKEIHARIPNTHLVMHGSSSVPQEYLEEIRKYGGQFKTTYGVPVEEIVEAIKYGVRKVNIDTDIRLAMTAAIRKYFVENPEAFDPRAYLKVAKQASVDMCKSRYIAFGCEGQASKIKPLPLPEMAKLYSEGVLKQKVNF